MFITIVFYLFINWIYRIIENIMTSHRLIISNKIMDIKIRSSYDLFNKRESVLTSLKLRGRHLAPENEL